MKDIFKICVNIIHVISFCGVILLGIIGIIYEVLGHKEFEKMLSAIGISKGFERIWIISIVMIFLLIVTYFLKNKVLVD